MADQQKGWRTMLSKGHISYQEMVECFMHKHHGWEFSSPLQRGCHLHHWKTTADKSKHKMKSDHIHYCDVMWISGKKIKNKKWKRQVA